MSPYFFATTHPYRTDFVTKPIDSETNITSEHFEYLRDLMNHGKLYLAGPTLQENDPFGVYIQLNMPRPLKMPFFIKNSPTFRKIYLKLIPSKREKR